MQIRFHFNPLLRKKCYHVLITMWSCKIVVFYEMAHCGAHPIIVDSFRLNYILVHVVIGWQSLALIASPTRRFNLR
jgi:hypothetical protein